MATPEAALAAALLGEATVSALVDDVFPVGGRQGPAGTYATFQRIDTNSSDHLDGPGTLDWPRLQLNIWADKALDARNAAEAIRTFLNKQERTAAGLTFTASLQADFGDFDEATRKHRVVQDYLIFHTRG